MTNPAVSARHLALCGKTTMTLQWIAKGLKMGAAGSAANLLRDEKR